MTCNFTYNHFVEILQKAENHHYSFVTFSEAVSCKGPYLIMRHDVDYSLDKALKMAEIEHELDIRSNYTFMTSSPFYNLFDHEGLSTIEKISGMGHKIGYHYETKRRNPRLGAKTKAFEREIRALEVFLRCKIGFVAPHDPELSNLPLRDEQGSLISVPDAYNKEFFTRIAYFSDSCQFWRSGCICNHLGHVEKMQVLIHPVWWSETGDSVYRALREVFTARAQKLTERVMNSRKFYRRFLAETKRELEDAI